MLGDDLLDLLGDRIPADHARQVVADDYVGEWYRRLRDRAGPARVLDLGCGAGDSVDFFRRFDPDVRWVGLDLPRSPEVDTRSRTDTEFATFDGEHIPFGDGEFELVFCKQVLEHVQRPGPLLEEVRRVLEPGGYLVGSTSQLEPYHSLSVANHTPYGLAVLLDEVGLPVVELRPNIDGLTLVVQRGMGRHRYFRRWWARESPLNRFIGVFGRAARLEARSVNAIKLLLCGQFCFLARRPADRHGVAEDPESVVRRFHERQSWFYSGGEAEPLLDLLDEQVVWHVPGRNAIAGDHRGRDAVMDYFRRRRELASATFTIQVRDVLAVGGTVVQVAGGTAERRGRRWTWDTVGIFRVADGRIAEGWLVPLDQAAFDEIWS